MHPVEDIEDIPLTVEGLKQVDVKQLYNPVTQTVRVSRSQLVEVRVAVRDSENQLPAEGWALRDPG